MTAKLCEGTILTPDCENRATLHKQLNRLAWEREFRKRNGRQLRDQYLCEPCWQQAVAINPDVAKTWEDA